MLKLIFFLTSCIIGFYGSAQFSDADASHGTSPSLSVHFHPVKELTANQKPEVFLKLPEVRYKVYNMADFLVFSDELCPPLNWGNRSMQRFQFEQSEFTVVREKRRK